MLTTHQAQKLRALIEDYAEAKSDADMAGAQTPEDAEQLRADLKKSREDLDALIDSLTK